MAVWRITGKIIRTTIVVNYICTRIMEFLHYVRFSSFFVFCVSVMVKLTIPLLCVGVHSA